MDDGLENPISPIIAPTLEEINTLSASLEVADRPMDNKTIENAIRKRLDEFGVKDIILKLLPGALMRIVICAQIPEIADSEVGTILVCDPVSQQIRHKQLLNIIDEFYNELVERRKKRKTNQLPADFLRDDKYQRFDGQFK